MTVYLTKTWGFSESCGPLQFSTQGWRDRARDILKDGDLVVTVGTKGVETAEGERGKLLGIMEPTKEPVMSLDFEVRQSPADFDEAGRYKWPFGLLNKQAWIIEERRLLTKMSERRFSMDAVQGIVPLTDEEARFTLSLRRRPVDLLSSVRAYSRVEGVEAARKRAAPPPTTTRSGVMHMRRASAFTYCMELVGATRPSFKIGWAFDYKLRAKQFNRASMPKLGGIQYVIRQHHHWDTAIQAFAMEQAVLDAFEAHLHTQNREVVSGVNYNDLQSAWTSAILKVMRHT